MINKNGVVGLVVEFSAAVLHEPGVEPRGGVLQPSLPL